MKYHMILIPSLWPALCEVVLKVNIYFFSVIFTYLIQRRPSTCQ